MRILPIIGGVAAVVVFFFAVIFAMSISAVSEFPALVQSRILTSVILFIIGLAIIAGIYYVTRKPKTVIQQLELSGKMSSAQIKCPNCGGSISASEIKITQGVPYVKCPYCGTTFEVTEEPKW
ncbi:MAG TPA: MJ0042-type zinc finger domain-containing protein [Candidatus Deferrimicrobiaceae bacterium]|nr:MJ0042-type zinc finger domain-containing protein [Candidatus Deferrimicrobiaceae bacterium]